MFANGRSQFSDARQPEVPGGSFDLDSSFTEIRAPRQRYVM